MAGTRACHDTCSGYHVNLIGARAKTGKLEHGGEPVEERVGQLQMSRRRTRLDSDVGGPFAFSLVRKFGDNHQHLSTDLDLSFGGVARTARNEDAGTHMSQCASACRGVKGHMSLTISDLEHPLGILTRAI